MLQQIRMEEPKLRRKATKVAELQRIRMEERGGGRRREEEEGEE